LGGGATPKFLVGQNDVMLMKLTTNAEITGVLIPVKITDARTKVQSDPSVYY